MHEILHTLGVQAKSKSLGASFDPQIDPKEPVQGLLEFRV